MKAVFLSWAVRNGRTVDLARALAIPAVFLGRSQPRNVLIRYTLQATATVRFLTRERPQVVTLMLPPTPLLLIVKAYALIYRCAIIADLHTGYFNDPKWAWALPISNRLLRKHAVVVTNQHLADAVDPATREIVVLDDPIRDLRRASDVSRSASTGSLPEFSVVCPLGYANDEPVNAILDAARKVDNVTWYFTGSPPPEVVAAAPPSVVFTGYLSDEAFGDLLASASCVLALTTRDFTMQRAGYEALMHGRPVITSDFQVLRAFFREAAIYTEPGGATLAQDVGIMMSQLAERSAAAASRLEMHLREQDGRLASLRALLRAHGYSDQSHQER